jgi:hypothetical protein
MSVERDVDVVVIGLGPAGATAATAAADAGARVLVLDRGEPAVELQAAVRAAGIAVRPLVTVHELLVEAGRVTGVGYATPLGAGARWLERAAAVATRDEWSEPGAAGDAGGQEAEVGALNCGSVVLALDPRHWEFVGPAAWSAVSAGRRLPAATRFRPPARLCLVPEDPPPGESPELTVRRWCATRTHGSLAAADQDRLRVDPATGLVLSGSGRPVPGLYSAVAAGPERGGIAAAVVAAQLAGRAAARPQVAARRGWLRSVG